MKRKIVLLVSLAVGLVAADRKSVVQGKSV